MCGPGKGIELGRGSTGHLPLTSSPAPGSTGAHGRAVGEAQSWNRPAWTCGSLAQGVCPHLLLLIWKADA